MDPIVARILLAYKKRDKGLPVRNKDTDRVVYVLPETLKEQGSKFEKVPPDEAGDVRYRGKSKPPAKPEKPHKPEISRDPPPAPIRPPQPVKRVKPPHPVKPVQPVKFPKVPEPDEPNKWKTLRPWKASALDQDLATNIVRRFQAATNYWDDAVKDLKKFNTLYAQVEKKPQDPAVLKKCIDGTNKFTKLIKWAELCLSYTLIDDTLLPAWKEVTRLAKAAEAPTEELSTAISQFKKALQQALDSTAPESFTYQGFKISNKDHLADELCRKVLAGIDFLKALFKKRGVESVVEEGIARINLVADTGGAFAFFNMRTREMTLPATHLAEGKPGRFFDTLASETILHEFGHYVHEHYIKGEAAEAWNAPWEGITDVKDVHPVLRKKDLSRREKIEPLEIVTDYGEVNQYEDFAETFMIFMAAPERLTPTAKFRMQRALSLSGLYGKPVMRLARQVAARFAKQA